MTAADGLQQAMRGDIHITATPVSRRACMPEGMPDDPEENGKCGIPLCRRCNQHARDDRCQGDCFGAGGRCPRMILERGSCWEVECDREISVPLKVIFKIN